MRFLIQQDGGFMAEVAADTAREAVLLFDATCGRRTTFVYVRRVTAKYWRTAVPQQAPDGSRFVEILDDGWNFPVSDADRAGFAEDELVRLRALMTMNGVTDPLGVS